MYRDACKVCDHYEATGNVGRRRIAIEELDRWLAKAWRNEDAVREFFGIGGEGETHRIDFSPSEVSVVYDAYTGAPGFRTRPLQDFLDMLDEIEEGA
jgi:hypothetical protein